MGKAWDTALAAMWDIHENLMEVSTKAQALTLPTLETLKNKKDKETQVLLELGPKAIYADKETQISIETKKNKSPLRITWSKGGCVGEPTS